MGIPADSPFGRKLLAMEKRNAAIRAKRKPKPVVPRFDLADRFLKALRLHAPRLAATAVREHLFAWEAMGRKWRFDLAWPEHLIAVECQGGERGYGKHNRPKGYQLDCEKHRAASQLGWRVFPFAGIELEPNVIHKAVEQLAGVVPREG